MSNTVGLILIIIMIIIYFVSKRNEKKEEIRQSNEKYKQHKEELAKIDIDYFRRIKEIVPNKTNEEYDAIAKQHGVNRIINNITWEQINRGIENK